MEDNNSLIWKTKYRFFAVLVDGEYAGSVVLTPEGQNPIVAAGLANDPKIIEVTDISHLLPQPASGYYWNGTSFEKRD